MREVTFSHQFIDVKTFKNPRTGNTIVFYPGKNTVVSNEDDISFLMYRDFIHIDGMKSNPDEALSFQTSSSREVQDLHPSKKPLEDVHFEDSPKSDVSYKVKTKDGIKEEGVASKDGESSEAQDSESEKTEVSSEKPETPNAQDDSEEKPKSELRKHIEEKLKEKNS